MENQIQEVGKKEGGTCETCCGRACNCIHRWVMPVLIVLFGLTFLSEAMGWLDSETVSVVWPSIVIIAGLNKMFAGMCKCC